MEESTMLRCFFVATILRLWEEGKIPSIPKIKVTINYTIRNILPFLIDFNSFFKTPTKINNNYAGMISEKEKMKKQIVLPLLLQEVENFSEL